MTGASGKSGASKRAERLKAALRDNLKRRKAQAKARAQGPGKGVTSAAEHDSAGITPEFVPAKPKG